MPNCLSFTLFITSASFFETKFVPNRSWQKTPWLCTWTPSCTTRCTTPSAPSQTSTTTDSQPGYSLPPHSGMKMMIYLTFLVVLSSGRHLHLWNPRLSTRKVWSQYCSQTKQSREEITAEPGFEPGAAGWEARILPLCYAAPIIC